MLYYLLNSNKYLVLQGFFLLFYKIIFNLSKYFLQFLLLLVKLVAILFILLPSQFIIQLPYVITFVTLAGSLCPFIVPYTLQIGIIQFYRVSQCREQDSNIGLLYQIVFRLVSLLLRLLISVPINNYMASPNIPNTDTINIFLQRLIDLFPKNKIQFLKLNPVFRLTPFLQQLIGLYPKTGIRIQSLELDLVFKIAI